MPERNNVQVRRELLAVLDPGRLDDRERANDKRRALTAAEALSPGPAADRSMAPTEPSTSPTFAGHTIYAWSEILEKIDLPGRADVGALRLRTVATKDKPCAGFPFTGPDGKPDPAVVLDLDYTVLMPRR